MIKTRDVIVSLATLGAASALFAATQGDPPPAVMKSVAFEWNDLPVKQSAKGETRKVFQGPTATLDELECHVTTLNPGVTSHPPHQHPDEEILIVKEGTVEALVAGEWKKLGPGSIIFQAANETHTIRNAGETPATYHVFKWNSPGMLKKKTE